MKQQFVITHTICQTEITALLDKLGYKYTFCQNVVSIKN